MLHLPFDYSFIYFLVAITTLTMGLHSYFKEKQRLAGGLHIVVATLEALLGAAHSAQEVAPVLVPYFTPYLLA